MRDWRRAAVAALRCVWSFCHSSLASAKAAGALAVGACAAYGYAYDYPSSEAAQTAAHREMRRHKLQRGRHHREGLRCALRSTAISPAARTAMPMRRKLGPAQNTALQYCYKFGGKDCVIRAWICDGKKS